MNVSYQESNVSFRALSSQVCRLSSDKYYMRNAGRNQKIPIKIKGRVRIESVRALEAAGFVVVFSN